MRLPFAVSAAVSILSGCGYIGEPLTPLLNIPNRVTDLAAVERGGVVIYQFTLPALSTEGKQARVGKIEIRAGDEWPAATTPLEAKPDENGHVRGEIPVGQWIGKSLILGVKVFGVNGRDAGWSNLVTVAVAPPLATPTEVQATPVAEGVRVSWQGPAGQYRVLRRVGQDQAVSTLATVEANQYLDTTTEYGKQFEYVIQAVKKTGNLEAESDISEPARVTPTDIFPPATPAGLNAIAATQNIELVWDRNTEPDLTGYRIYRALGDGALEKIADVQDAPSYSDRKVEAGKPYRYAVSAVDRLGNESKLSQPVEIIAP